MPRTRATVCKWRASMATRTVPRLSAHVISVIVPTYNEAGSLPPLVDRLASAMAGHTWELVVVDDGSPVGSRYIKGGATMDGPLRRRVVSRVACLVGNVFVPVRDATSGFFALRRTAIDGVHLNAIGFKIGFKVIARAKTKTIVEVPYTFRDRELGASKFGRREVVQYL